MRSGGGGSGSGPSPKELLPAYREIQREFMEREGLARAKGELDPDDRKGPPLFSKEFFEAQMEVVVDEAVPVYAAGLRLEHMETRVVPCPFAQDYRRHGDAGRFADEYIPTIRTWNESTYYGALSAERPEAERRELIEEYYDAYKARVRNNPAGHGMDYVHAYMVIVKN